MRKIKRKNYKDWQSYYWNYQKFLAKDYYIPYLRKNSSNFNRTANINILDIGCGNGGFLYAFKKDFKKNIKVNGIDIKKFSSWDKNPTDYSVHNILKNENDNFIEKYDLIILRDVIEHINFKDKKRFMRIVTSFLKNEGEILVTFPPYLSPFGLHQQTILKSFLKYFPFLSILPESILKIIVNRFEDEDIWQKIAEIIDSGMTISYFKKILNRTGLKIYKQRYFSVRPSHQIRYGVKTLRSPFGSIPFLREFLVLGTCYILKIKNPTS